MSKPLIGKWSTIVAAKTRRRERLEQDVARERGALAERQAALDDALRARDHAQQRCTGHEERIDALIDGAASLSSAEYLRHDSWRGALKATLDAERKAEQKCRTALERQQERLRASTAALAHAEAALDQCRSKLHAALRAAAYTAELAAEEEATENLLARRYAR